MDKKRAILSRLSMLLGEYVFGTYSESLKTRKLDMSFGSEHKKSMSVFLLELC